MIAPGVRVTDPDSTMCGVVEVYPAVDPDGHVHPALVSVRWDDGTFEIVDIDAVWPVMVT